MACVPCAPEMRLIFLESRDQRIPFVVVPEHAVTRFHYIVSSSPWRFRNVAAALETIGAPPLTELHLQATLSLKSVN